MKNKVLITVLAATAVAATGCIESSYSGSTYSSHRRVSTPSHYRSSRGSSLFQHNLPSHIGCPPGTHPERGFYFRKPTRHGFTNPTAPRQGHYRTPSLGNHILRQLIKPKIPTRHTPSRRPQPRNKRR